MQLRPDTHACSGGGPCCPVDITVFPAAAPRSSSSSSSDASAFKADGRHAPPFLHARAMQLTAAAAIAILRPLLSPTRHAVQRFLLLRSSPVGELVGAVVGRSMRCCASNAQCSAPVRHGGRRQAGSCPLRLFVVSEDAVQQRRPRGCGLIYYDGETHLWRPTSWDWTFLAVGLVCKRTLTCRGKP